MIGTEGVEAFANVVWSLRWLWVALAFIAAAGVVGAANSRADRAEQRARRAKADVAELERENAALRRQIHRKPVVVLPPRKGSETSHG